MIVAREREHVVVLVDPRWVRLEALRVRIVVPVSVLTVSFTQAFQENHERQRCHEHEVIEGPDIAGLKQQIVSFLESVDGGRVLQRGDEWFIGAVASIVI